jgi:hypothetical protein
MESVTTEMDRTARAVPTNLNFDQPDSGALRNSLARALGTSYELGELLGRGGMASVFRAFDRRLRRPVAIKVFSPGVGVSQELKARFLKEAQTAAGLSHPHIVPVYDVGHDGELLWFVMAFVSGESLASHVEKRGRLTDSEARRVLMEVAQALAYAHARGIVHRDIKPDNILLDEANGRAMVADFGVARVQLDADGSATLPGVVIGTTRYMAPEQALGRPDVDGRADMYSLGLVGCFLLTGHDAQPARSLPEAIAQHLRGEAIDLTEVEGQAPVELVDALRRCLAAIPDDRFARMEEFVEAAQSAGTGPAEVPAGVRAFFRQSEQALIISSITLIGLGLVGVERVSPAFVLLVLGAVLGQWIISLERARRVGMRWGTVRAAIYLERSRRLEEARIQALPISGPVGVITLFGTCIAFVELLRRSGTAESTWWNWALFAVGSLGVLAAAWGLGIAPTRGAALPPSLQTRYAAVGTVLVVLAGLYVRSLRTDVEYWQLQFIVALVATAIATFMILRMRLRANATRSETEPAAEWRVPRWLDWAGSVAFGRFTRRGGQIVFERESTEMH